MSHGRPTRVVILGGGFAGISAALRLTKKTRRDDSVEVHLVNDENYFVFQPLLPEVVACGIEPSHILNPIRQLCRHANFHRASVEHIDLEAKIVSLVGADARVIHTLDYDHLVIALGLTIDLSRNPGMTEHSLPIKTLGDAFHLRNHVLSRLEEADIEKDEQKRKRLLTVVAVGGGFSGVETVAEINDMIRACLRYYPTARETGVRVVLVHSRPRILNELSEGLARFAEKKLAARGVELMLEQRVSEATPDGLVLQDGQAIPAATVICTVGNAPHPLVRQMDLVKEKERLVVDDHLRAKGRDDIWAVGDSAMVPDVKRGGWCPPTAQYAMRQGKTCADNIFHTIRNRNTRPFVFGGLGQLAVVGHHSGVAEIFGIRIAGLLAWWLWRSVYWSKLPGLRCKLRVGLDWAIDTVFPRDIAMIATDRTETLRRAHFRAGDSIVRQGEVGDRFYIIESGEVEVIEELPDGTEKRIATRTAGESFGEIALIKNVTRTATVRCTTPVDVISFTRKDFQTLVGSYEHFKLRVDTDLKERTAESAEPERTR